MRCRALLVAVAFTAACGELPLEPRDPTPGVPHFKIASYNVENGKHDDASTLRAVGATGAEIVCLQEVTPEWKDVLAARYADEYPHQLFRPKGGSGGLGVLSRWPVWESGFHPGPNGWHPAWHFLVETPAGLVQVLNVHLRSLFRGNGDQISSYLASDEDHRESIQYFTDECGELPTLVVGDFNEGPDGDAVRFLERQGFENALPLFRPGQYTWRHPSVGGQLNLTIDHILFDGSFEPLNAYVEARGRSDHIPVVAHLEAPRPWADSPLQRGAEPEVQAAVVAQELGPAHLDLGPQRPSPEHANAGARR